MVVSYSLVEGIETGTKQLGSQQSQVVYGEFLKVLHSWLDANSDSGGYERDMDDDGIPLSGDVAREAMSTGRPSMMG